MTDVAELLQRLAAKGPARRLRIEAVKAISALEAELEAERFTHRNGPSLSEAAIHAIREMLNANDVPLAAFIDDHVGNAIVQRNQARAVLNEVEACMSIVEPRSNKAEYMRILGVVRAALQSKGGKDD